MNDLNVSNAAAAAGLSDTAVVLLSSGGEALLSAGDVARIAEELARQSAGQEHGRSLPIEGAERDRLIVAMALAHENSGFHDLIGPMEEAYSALLREAGQERGGAGACEVVSSIDDLLALSSRGCLEPELGGLASNILKKAKTAILGQRSAKHFALRGAIARGWCSEGNSHKEMDAVLAEAIAQEIESLYAAPTDAQSRIADDFVAENAARMADAYLKAESRIAELEAQCSHLASVLAESTEQVERLRKLANAVASSSYIDGAHKALPALRTYLAALAAEKE